MTETEVPDWQLERYRLAELPASEMAVVARRAAEDARVQARLSALDASDAELLRERPPSRVVAAIQAQAEPPSRQGLPLLPALVAGLGLAAVIFVMVPGPKAPDAIRVKGLAPRLLLYRQVSGASVEALEPGSVARQDDLVQIAYVSAGAHYGVIVSIDSRGVVTRHLPAEGPAAVPLQAGGARALAQAYKLDDAPDFERFYLVASDQPFAVDTVVAAAVQAHRAPSSSGRLALPPPLAQVSFELRKQGLR